MSSIKITNEYRSVGVDEFYKNIGNLYVNPHKEYVLKCLDSLVPASTESVLDLACGTGDVSLHLKCNCTGVDKYLHQEYRTITSNECYQYSFEEIANKNPISTKFDLIICSYAFDLVPESYRFNLLYSLSTISAKLILIRPNSHVLDNPFWKIKSKVKHNKSKGVLYETF